MMTVSNTRVAIQHRCLFESNERDLNPLLIATLKQCSMGTARAVNPEEG